MGTMFASVYDRFLGKITDDMYMELTPLDTLKDLQNLLINSIPGFEFPRIKLDFTIGEFEVYAEELSYNDTSSFEEDLSSEEINILALLMLEGWLQRQITSIENTRQKYSGTDFKMTSQANHLAKLLVLLAEAQRQSLHMQRLYKRRKKDKTGHIKSNWSALRGVSSLDD